MESNVALTDELKEVKEVSFDFDLLKWILQKMKWKELKRRRFRMNSSDCKSKRLWSRNNGA